MSTNKPFSLDKKGGPIHYTKSATVQDMFQPILGLCTGKYGIVYTQYGYVNVYTYCIAGKFGEEFNLANW